MRISNHGNQAARTIFVSFAEQEKGGLDKIVHAGAHQPVTAPVDAINQRRLPKLPVVVLQTRRMPNGEEVTGYFEEPTNSDTVFPEGNHSSGVDEDLEDYRSNDKRTESPPSSSPLQGDFANPILPPTTILGILSFFMSEENRHSFIGDLQERFRIKIKQKGRRGAIIWFWRQMIFSLFSLALEALKRVSGFEKLVERYRRIGS